MLHVCITHHTALKYNSILLLETKLNLLLWKLPKQSSPNPLLFTSFLFFVFDRTTGCESRPSPWYLTISPFLLPIVRCTLKAAEHQCANRIPSKRGKGSCPPKPGLRGLESELGLALGTGQVPLRFLLSLSLHTPGISFQSQIFILAASQPVLSISLEVKSTSSPRQNVGYPQHSPRRKPGLHHREQGICRTQGRTLRMKEQNPAMANFVINLWENWKLLI